MSIKPKEILDCLDASNDGYCSDFIELGQPYSFLIDVRLNIFRGPDSWAIAAERLGFSPRAGAITLDIHYYGNCLINLEYYNDRPSNYYSIYPIEFNNFTETTNGELLKPDAKSWLVRGNEILLSHFKNDYDEAGITLQEFEPNEIRVEEAGRLCALKNGDLFRATNSELYKSIPNELKKILVLDEWFHKDFRMQAASELLNKDVKALYESYEKMNAVGGLSFDEFAKSLNQHNHLFNENNKENWENNRPGSYETWQMIAEVIFSNDPGLYKPTKIANTHWSNWPESGCL